MPHSTRKLIRHRTTTAIGAGCSPTESGLLARCIGRKVWSPRARSALHQPGWVISTIDFLHASLLQVDRSATQLGRILQKKNADQHLPK